MGIKEEILAQMDSALRPEFDKAIDNTIEGAFKEDVKTLGFMVANSIKCQWEVMKPHLFYAYCLGVKAQEAKSQAVPGGFVLVPKEPSYKMWGGIARHLCRYAQMHDRYSPKSLKKYFDMFIGDTPAWLNAEVSNWESDHAFATADIGVFIYKAMIEAQKPSSTSDCPDEP